MKTINWDEYFISIAELSAMRSKDPSTKVGACIVNENKVIIGTGYNGMPLGKDDAFPWGREGEKKDTKYPYVVHAELNAILNSSTSVKGAIVYTTLYPCSECAKFIAQSGVGTIVYSSDKYANTDDNIIAKTIFERTNVETRQIGEIEITLTKK